MENSIEHRIHYAVSSLMQNESLMEGLETEAASALLEWASQCIADIFNEIGDLDDAAVDEVTSPRLRAVRQMMRQVSLLACGRPGLDPAACSGLLDQIILQAALVYGARFTPPKQRQRAEFLFAPIVNNGQWISSLRSWLET